MKNAIAMSLVTHLMDMDEMMEKIIIIISECAFSSSVFQSSVSFGILRFMHGCIRADGFVIVESNFYILLLFSFFSVELKRLVANGLMEAEIMNDRKEYYTPC